MEHSETLAALAAALGKAQAKLEPAVMDAVNPFLKSKYANLGSVIEAARGPLAENGLAVSQMVTGHGDEIGVTTVLMHSSGEWLSSTVSLPLQKEAGKSLAQAAGSVVTYLRRYALAAALGIYADEDTDGHLPQQDAPRGRQRAAQPPPAAPADTGELMTDRTRGRLFALLGERGITDPQIQRDGIARVIGRPITSRSELTEAEARQVIASLERKPA